MALPNDATTFRAVIDGYVVTCDKTPAEITVGDDCYVVHTREGREVERLKAKHAARRAEAKREWAARRKGRRR